MGLYNSQDIFQEKMNKLFNDLDYVRMYIDDPLIISNKSLEICIKELDKVLSKLKMNWNTYRFQNNQRKNNAFT